MKFPSNGIEATDFIAACSWTSYQRQFSAFSTMASKELREEMLWLRIEGGDEWKYNGLCSGWTSQLFKALFLYTLPYLFFIIIIWLKEFAELYFESTLLTCNWALLSFVSRSLVLISRNKENNINKHKIELVIK